MLLHPAPCETLAHQGAARAQVTVSTVGVVPRIRALAAELPGVSLALSLHAPNQALRTRIVPSARAYPLERLMAAVAEYQAASGMRARPARDACCHSGRLLLAKLVMLVVWGYILSAVLARQHTLSTLVGVAI